MLDNKITKELKFWKNWDFCLSKAIHHLAKILFSSQTGLVNFLFHRNCQLDILFENLVEDFQHSESIDDFRTTDFYSTRFNFFTFPCTALGGIFAQYFYLFFQYIPKTFVLRFCTPSYNHLSSISLPYRISLFTHMLI